METFIITFSKVGIRNGWVEVHAKSEEIARAWARKEYDLAWSGIYTADDWPEDVRALYPLGKIGETTLHYEDARHV